MSRYLIKEEQPSEKARSYGIDYPMYVVWDTVAGKTVPFGRHRDRDRALTHIERLESR